MPHPVFLLEAAMRLKGKVLKKRTHLTGIIRGAATTMKRSKPSTYMKTILFFMRRRPLALLGLVTFRVLWSHQPIVRRAHGKWNFVMNLLIWFCVNLMTASSGHGPLKTEG